MVSLFVVQKFMNDEFYSAGYFSRMYPVFSKQDLMEMESTFLDFMDFEIYFQKDELYNFYGKLFCH